MKWDRERKNRDIDETKITRFVPLASGWLGRAMVLGSFQCRGVLLHWHMAGQGPAVLAAGAGLVGYALFLLNLVYPIFLF